MNLRSIISALIILLSALLMSCANAQPPKETLEVSDGKDNSYEAWKEEAKTNIRLLPKYGHLPKTKDQKAADQELIDAYVKQQGTRHKGSEVLISLGFDHLYKGRIREAMYRFNQAWLLDSSNVDVQWGFGAVYHALGDYESAMKQYDEGLRIDPKNSKIITDKATLYMADYYTNNDNKKLSEAITLFKQSYALDSKNQNTLFKLSVSYFLQNDCINAKKYYKECMDLGGKPVTSDYTKALTEKCK